MNRLYTFLLICALTGVSVSATAQSWGDYTLYSTGNSTKAYLLNMNGSVYHTWTFNSSNRTGYSSYLLPGGYLLRTVAYSPNSFFSGGQTGKLQKADWNGNVVWEFVYSTTSYAMHHDICPMPNGNVLLIAYESKTPAQASQAGCSANTTIWSEKIVEVKQTGPTTGEIVWEWHLWDHLVQNINPNKDNYETTIVDHPDRLNINYKIAKDWLHANGIDYNPILDQIVFSSHNLNEIYVIDHSTTTEEAATGSGGNSGKGGRFLYRWGNPAAYQAQGTTIFNIVHDGRWIHDGSPYAGWLAAFNNRGVSSMQSSIDQIQPPREDYNYTITPGAAYLPSTYTIRHACNGGSYGQGGSQTLPNGNLLVTMTTSGLIYEVNEAGSTVWSKQINGMAAKAYRYSEHYINNLPPDIPEISVENNILVCTEADTYQWYRNGNLIEGATEQTYQPTEEGIYLVRITDEGYNFYAHSKGVEYAPTATCSIIAVPNIPKYGQISGTGVYSYGEIVTLTALPEAVCKFTFWSENGDVVSRQREYTFEVTSNRDLIAHFELKGFGISYEYDLTDGGYTKEISFLNHDFNNVFNTIHDKITLSPNPAKNTVTINAGNVLRTEILDLQGNMISVFSNTSVLNLENIKNGIYLLRIHSDKGISTQKLIILK